MVVPSFLSYFYTEILVVWPVSRKYFHIYNAADASMYIYFSFFLFHSIRHVYSRNPVIAVFQLTCCSLIRKIITVDVAVTSNKQSHQSFRK